jgi:Integrase core domain
MSGELQRCLRDDLLNGEIFYSLQEAKIIIGSWRRHHNVVRPHASLAYRPPESEVFVPAFAACPASLRRPVPLAKVKVRVLWVWRTTICSRAAKKQRRLDVAILPIGSAGTRFGRSTGLAGAGRLLMNQRPRSTRISMISPERTTPFSSQALDFVENSPSRLSSRTIAFSSTGTIVATPVLSGLHHHHARI